MSEHARPSSVKPRDSRSSVSSQQLTEEFDHILPEKRVKFDNDWNCIEKFVEEELSPSPCSLPTLPLPPQITESHDSEIWMSSGNKEDPESSVSDSSTLTQATKKEVLKTWEFVDGLLRESLRRSDRDSENSVSSKKFNKEMNSTVQEEFENKNGSNRDNVEDLLRKKQLLPPPPPLLIPGTSPVWLAPPQSHTNTVLTQGGVQEHNMFRLPPPTFTHHAPLHAHPPFIRAPLGVTSKTKAPFSLGAHMFRPPPPTFTHHAPPPSLVLPAVQQMIIRPPALPAGDADSQELNLHSLSIRCLPPASICCLPIGVLNGETLHNAVHTPRNVNTSKHNKRVGDQQDDGRPYVKKPPNAFMLFLKEVRPQVASELNISKSPMVNRVVGEMWTSLPVEVKAIFFEKARLEQKLHQQQHPGWSTGDNYGKKRKRVKNKTSEQQLQQQQQYSLIHSKASPISPLNHRLRLSRPNTTEGPKQRLIEDPSSSYDN